MKLKNPEGWKKATGGELNPYAKAIVKVAKKTMEFLEATTDFDANDLIIKADEELKEGITGNMAGMIALLISKYHKRGDEFKKSWNGYYGKENAKGVVNPAILIMKSKKA
jgi:hypothetical protein